MWLEIELSRVESEVRVTARGQRGEQTAPQRLGFDLEAIRGFAATVRSAAARGRPLPALTLESAHALHRAVLNRDIDPIRARLAEASGGPLLIRLSLSDTELQGVPWEALCKPGEAMGFWASSPDCLVVRGVTTSEPRRPRAVRGALRVLGIAPAGGGALAVLEHALSARIRTGEVEWLDPISAQSATAARLFDRLRRDPAPHVIHFLGHGGHQGGVPVLRLADDDDGEEAWLPVELLAQQLKASLHGSVPLIVLEACEGARPGAFTSAAETLVRAGADAVVAHLWPVKADVARTCSAELYRALAGGEQGKGDVALAINEARRALLGALGGSAEAFSPVLYLRGQDGVIFDLERTAACLVLDQGTRDARVFPLRPGRTRIGRTADNDIVLQRQGISRRHAEVHSDGDRLEVHDCGSHNGCYVNGARITRARVRIGDVLRLGDVELEIAAEDAGGAAKPACKRNVHALHFPRSDIEAPVAASGPETRLAVLLQASQMLVYPDGVERMLDRALDLALQVLPVDRVALLLLDEAGDLAPRGVRSRLPIPPGERIWSRSVVDYVTDHVTAALFADAATDPRIEGAGSVLSQGIQAAMGTPLKAGDRVLGVLYADSLRGGRPWKQDDLDLLVGFANQAALALDHAMSRERALSEAVARGKLEQFFSPSTAARILEAQGARLDVREARVTALFCEVSGYSELALTAPPRAVLDLLDEYVQIVQEAVFGEGGTLEPAAGAAALAVWGAPFASKGDADRAAAAALAMQRAAAGRRFKIAVGLHTGPAAAGNIGKAQALRFAAAGGTTELARRICGAAAAGEILISAETAAAVRGGLAVLSAGHVDVLGTPVEVCRISTQAVVSS